MISQVKVNKEKGVQYWYVGKNSSFFLSFFYTSALASSKFADSSPVEESDEDDSLLVKTELARSAAVGSMP